MFTRPSGLVYRMFCKACETLFTAPSSQLLPVKRGSRDTQARDTDHNDELPHKDPSQSTRPTNATATVDASLPQTTPNGCVSHAARFLLHDVRRVPACVYAASGAYTRIGAFSHPTPRLRICACTRWCWWVRLAVYSTRVGAYTHPGCVHAGRCVYAGRGAYTQWVHICTRVCIRGSVRIRERWVRIRSGRVHVYVNAPGCDVCIRGSVRLRERWVCIHRFLRIRTPDRRAYTQESTNRNARS